MSCHSNALLEPEVPGYLVIDGDTVKPRVEKDISLLMAKTQFIKTLVVVGDTTIFYPATRLASPPHTFPDLTPFKEDENKDLPFQYVAYGSSMTAGFRDGGYFNDGMSTSYPLMIARQMGLKDFEVPAFSNENVNGVGRLVQTTFNPTGGPAPKFKIVNNNLGITRISESDLVLEKHRDATKVGNWAVANSERWQLLRVFKDGGEDLFADRIGEKGYSGSIGNLKPDLVTLESGYTDLVKMVNGETLAGTFGAVIPWGPIGNNEHRLAYASVNASTEGRNYMLCIANLPDPMDTPLFHVVTAKDVYNSLLIGRDIIFRSDVNLGDYVFLMNSRLDSLMSPRVNLALKADIINRFLQSRTGLGGPINLKDYYSEFTSGSVYNNLRYKNHELELLSKEYKFPVIDLYTMFKEIREGKFVTDDGVFVEFKYPGGNFYSNDGFYPTAFGQAVIANEFIKALNNHYKTKIPLIHTKEYLQ